MQVTDRPSPDAPSLIQAIIVLMVYSTPRNNGHDRKRKWNTSLRGEAQQQVLLTPAPVLHCKYKINVNFSRARTKHTWSSVRNEVASTNKITPLFLECSHVLWICLKQRWEQNRNQPTRVRVEVYHRPPWLPCPPEASASHSPAPGAFARPSFDAGQLPCWDKWRKMQFYVLYMIFLER